MLKNLRTKFIAVFVCLLTISIAVQAQVTTNGGSGLQATYSSLEAAITALNAATITSPVVITLTASNPQTAPAGGYEIRAEGSATNTIRIVGNNNTITASAALTAGNLNDGIFKIIGGDFISLEDFSVTENAANTVTDAATNNMTEWGIAILNASTTNGSQNVTIKGCTIDLNRTYQNTFGIYNNCNHSATAPTTAVPATATGTSSGLTIIANNITDVNVGIVVIGPTPANAENDGITIGGSAVNGNTITNFGTTSTFSGFANVSGTVNGILLRCSKNFTISHNSITSSDGGVIGGNLRAVYCAAPANPPLQGTTVNSVSNNTISLKSGNVAAGAVEQGIFVETSSVNATSTLNITNNNFVALTHTVANASAITGILNSSPAFNVNINGNTFTNLSVNTTGNFTFISSSVTLPAGGSHQVNNNSIVTAFNKTGAGGTVTLFTSTSNSPTGSVSSVSNNNFSNITVAGNTIIAGWISRDGASTINGPTKTVSNNTFTNWVSELGAITVLTENASAPGSTASGNVINNITGGGTVIGISLLANTNTTLTGNLVHTLTGTGGFPVTGISMSGTSNNPNDVKVVKNKIYNLVNSNAAGFVNGITCAFIGTAAVTNATVLIANNLIGDLKAPNANNDVTDVIRGINITATAVTSNINVFFNTVYINATSTGSHFGTSGVFHANNATSTTATLEMGNNIIVNTSTANGLGQTVAYKRSASGFGNYAEASNFNIFYAGTPSATNLIYYDGTSASTLADYKVAAGVRETFSKTENVPFTSTNGADNSFLHINTSVATQAQNGGTPIIGITDDFDGDVRSTTTPDIGADEFVTVLPVTFSNFNGVKEGTINLLSWTTLTETNNTGFELLRSADGIQFEKIAFIATKAENGNSNQTLNYQFKDQSPLQANNYYRLKQIDKDGRTSLSSIVLLKSAKTRRLEIVSVYPNPVKDNLTILLGNDKSEKATISITDYSGKTLIQQAVQLTNGTQTLQINTSTLSNKTYLLVVKTNEEVLTTKFMKQ